MRKSNMLFDIVTESKGEKNKMGTKIMLRIIDYGNGEWKFDVIRGMNDDEVRKLIARLKYIENELTDLLVNDLIKVSETVEFIKEKNRRFLLVE